MNSKGSIDEKRVHQWPKGKQKTPSRLVQSFCKAKQQCGGVTAHSMVYDSSLRRRTTAPKQSIGNRDALIFPEETALHPFSSCSVSPLSEPVLDSLLGDGSSGAMSANETEEKKKEREITTYFIIKSD